MTFKLYCGINIIEFVDGLQKISEDGGAIPPTSTKKSSLNLDLGGEIGFDC